MKRLWSTTLLFASIVASASNGREARIGDVATVEGVRENQLVGYGLVVGLNGTGDRRQTIFTMQMLASAMQRMGVQVPASAARVNNVAAVFVTARLPQFAAAGTQIDVTVSSVGDAKSLEGGLLLLTPLRAADGQVYAAAQGPLTIGGYAAGQQGNTRQSNHPTVGRVPAGGIVERAVATSLGSDGHIALLMREADFANARAVADRINRDLGDAVAVAVDGRTVQLDAVRAHMDALQLLARVQNLTVAVQARARVIINERTGTIVMGRDVTLGSVSILHGNLAIEISTAFRVSQPTEFSSGQTVVVPEQTVRVKDGPVRRIELMEGANVEQLVNGLQTIGATSRDVIAIIQAIKSAGALNAELEII